ncbi:MAG: hypothetical protein Pars2KO_07380 [Parasphingorhabdus sp.]
MMAVRPGCNKKDPLSFQRTGLFCVIFFLPEEVVDHIDDFAGIGVDQKHIVIITDPACAAISGW